MNKRILYVLIAVVVIVSIIFISGRLLRKEFDTDSDSSTAAHDINGDAVFPGRVPVPMPSGDLSVSTVVLLPDLYQAGKGFTCTGLAYDNTSDTFLAGEIGALLPNEQVRSSIIRLSKDLSTVIETIPLYDVFSAMIDVQGITFDTSDNTIWFCSHAENKIWNMSASGERLGSITTPQPTGVAYSGADDTFWVLSYDDKIRHIDKSGSVLQTIPFSYNETLDQCLLDEDRGLLYITAGANYTSRNNVYCLNIDTQEQYIACTVDSYAVEGIWLGDGNKMIILNDGYYHSAAAEKNQANIYTVH